MAKKITITDDMLKLTTIPNLARDTQWDALFINIMDRRMKTLHKDIRELMDKKKEAEIALKMKRMEKKKLMKSILIYSDEINSKGNEESITKLELAKNNIESINDTIDELMYTLEEIPSHMRQKNYELLKLTLGYAYSDLSDNKENIDSINNEIDRLRNRIIALKEKRKEYDDSSNTLYSYLHRTIGHKNTEELDELFLL